MLKRLHFGQLLILLSFSMSLLASELRQELKSIEDLGPENCVDVLETLEQDLRAVSPTTYLKEIREEGHEVLLHDLWTTKVALHERLRSFHRTTGLSESCGRRARGTLYALRAMEDQVTEHLYRSNKGSMAFPADAFAPGNIHVRRHPDYPVFDLKKDLQSGDVILTRGNAYTSAAIANLGEFDTQFSHMSMVYRDEKGKLWTVEAHIEVGVFVRPLEEHIKDKNARTVIFRFEDEALAAKAAAFIFKKVAKASREKGNINYDFSFDQDREDALFCSEVISYAFEAVTAGTLKVPMWRSKLQVRKPKFMQMLGIKARSSFIPSDIEIDPRFKMIAEWRDAAKLNDSLQKDAVLQSVYSWSDKFGYEMKQGSSGASKLYRNLAWPLRRIPLLGIFVKNKLPLNMPRSLIGYFGVIDSLGKLLQADLKVKDQQTIQDRGLPLLPLEKEQFLEELRQSKKKKLEKMFGPKGK